MGADVCNYIIYIMVMATGPYEGLRLHYASHCTQLQTGRHTQQKDRLYLKELLQSEYKMIDSWWTQEDSEIALHQGKKH